METGVILVLFMVEVAIQVMAEQEAAPAVVLPTRLVQPELAVVEQPGVVEVPLRGLMVALAE